MTQSACGTKKKRPAAIHNVRDAGPAAAANAIQRGERIAATYMSTRSRDPSWRWSSATTRIIENCGA